MLLTFVAVVWAVAALGAVALCVSAADGDAGGWGRALRERRRFPAAEREPDGTWRPAV